IAAGGQARFADRVRASAADVVRRARVAPSLRARARPVSTIAPRLRRPRWRLLRCAAEAAAAGAVLRWGDGDRAAEGRRRRYGGQAGHSLRLQNRPGNLHDSKQAVAFLREMIVAVRARLGRGLPLEFRMDAAFFQRDVLRLLAARGCAYAIKVGYWSWLPLKHLAAARRQWHALAPDVTGFEHQLVIPQWNLRLRVMIYRKHVQHESPKNFQLDLFTPDDGHF